MKHLLNRFNCVGFIVYTVLIMLVSTSYGQEKGKVSIKRYESGAIKDVIEYDKNGFPGVAKYFYENGNIMAVGEWGGGDYTLSGEMTTDKVGVWRHYHENGKLAVEGRYYFDKPEGEWHDYNENGRLIKIYDWGSNYAKLYNGGSYLEESYLQSEGKMVDNMPDGEWKNYFYNGKVSVIFLWKENKLLGVKEVYDINGKPIDKGSLNNGNGTIDFFNQNGDPVQYKVKDGVIIEINGKAVK